MSTVAACMRSGLVLHYRHLACFSSVLDCMANGAHNKERAHVLDSAVLTPNGPGSRGFEDWPIHSLWRAFNPEVQGKVATRPHCSRMLRLIRQRCADG